MAAKLTLVGLERRVAALETLVAATLRPDGHVAGCAYRDRRGPDVPCDRERVCEALRAFAAARAESEAR